MKYFIESLKAHKKEKIIIMLTLIIVTCIVTSIQAKDFKGVEGDWGLSLFYDVINSGIVVWVYLAGTLLITNLAVSDEFLDNKSNFKSMIITRIGYKKYYKNVLIKTFLTSFIAVVIWLIALLIFIHFTQRDISFDYGIQVFFTQKNLIINNQMYNLIALIIITAGGYGLFSLFVNSLQVFINNIYVYRIAPIMLSVFLYSGTFLFLETALGNTPLLEFIGVFIYIGTLLNPFVLTTTIFKIMSPYEAFACCILFYGALTYILQLIKYKKFYYS